MITAAQGTPRLESSSPCISFLPGRASERFARLTSKSNFTTVFENQVPFRALGLHVADFFVATGYSALKKKGERRGLGEDRTGEERRGQERRGQERTGKDRRGEERRGQERRGEERRGQERTGEERRGEEKTGEEKRGEERGRARARGRRKGRRKGRERKKRERESEKERERERYVKCHASYTVSCTACHVHHVCLDHLGLIRDLELAHQRKHFRGQLLHLTSLTHQSISTRQRERDKERERERDGERERERERKKERKKARKQESKKARKQESKKARKQESKVRARQKRKKRKSEREKRKREREEKEKEKEKERETKRCEDKSWDIRWEDVKMYISSSFFTKNPSLRQSRGKMMRRSLTRASFGTENNRSRLVQERVAKRRQRTRPCARPLQPGTERPGFAARSRGVPAIQKKVGVTFPRNASGARYSLVPTSGPGRGTPGVNLRCQSWTSATIRKSLCATSHYLSSKPQKPSEVFLRYSPTPRKHLKFFLRCQPLPIQQTPKTVWGSLDATSHYLSRKHRQFSWTAYQSPQPSDTYPANPRNHLRFFLR